jgi:hypothetical protein
MKKSIKLSRIFKSLLLAVVLAFTLNVPSRAQTPNPSLQETLGWLTKKIKLYSGDFDSGVTSGNRVDCKYEVTSVSPNFVLLRSCEFRFGTNAVMKQTDRFTFALINIDPRFVQVIKGKLREDGTNVGSLQLNTIDKGSSITIEQRSITTIGGAAQPEQVFTRQVDGITIWFFNDVMATRVARAFEFAIEESLKAAGKSTEPF